LLVDGVIVMQLHKLEEGHHHGSIGDPRVPVGNGVALWFEAASFDEAVERIKEPGAAGGQGQGVEIVTDVHLNPNAGHREIWLRDPDGYLVVLAEADAS